MNRKQINKWMKLWMNLSAIVVLVGAILKIQHHSYGQLIFVMGVASWFLSLGIKSILSKSKKKTVKID